MSDDKQKLVATKPLKFKTPIVQERFANMTQTAQKLAKEMSDWAFYNYNVELVFTSTWTLAAEDMKLGRVSDSHRTGRAFDIRTKGLKEDFKKAFCEYFNALYQKSLGAQTKDGPMLIVDKPHGSGPHWHVQVRRGVK